MIKYIFTDLDGTLFYPRDRKEMVKKENLFFLQSFIDNGGKVVLVSGRSEEFARKVVAKIGRECGIICYNGSVIIDGDNYLKKVPFERNKLKSICKDLHEEYSIPGIALFTGHGIRAGVYSKFFAHSFVKKVYDFSQGNYSEDFTYKIDDYLKTLDNEDVFKVLAVCGVGPRSRKKALQITEVLKAEYPDYEIAWADTAIEISEKNNTKGVAVKLYCEKLGIDLSEVAVVGDSGNDIPMFNLCPENSYCMKHAHKSIQRHAKYTVTKIEDLSRYLSKK